MPVIRPKPYHERSAGKGLNPFTLCGSPFARSPQKKKKNRESQFDHFDPPGESLMKAHHPPVVSLREASGQSNALLAPLMHCIRKTATIESAAHCLRYLPKDPRLRPLSSRAGPRRILASCIITTTNSSSSIGHTTTKTTTTSIRRQAFGKNANRSSVVSVIAKSHRSSRRSLCSALLALRDELLRGKTTTQTEHTSNSRSRSNGGKQIPGERQLVRQQFFRDDLV